MIARTRNFFALERNVLASVLMTALIMSGLGMWSQFMPKYLEALGAPVIAVGALATMAIAFLSVSFVLGGHLSDMYGRKRMFLFGTLLGVADTLIFVLSPSWVFAIPGMIITSFVVGTILTSESALVTESLPKNKRATGRASIQVSSLLTVAVVAPIGGVIVDQMGMLDGVRQAMYFDMAMTLVAAAVGFFMIKETLVRRPGKKPWPGISSTVRFVRGLPAEVKNLVISRAFSLFAWGLVATYFVYYALDIVRITALEWGIVGSIASTVMMMSTFVGAKISDRYGRKHTILVTFAAAAAVPLLYVLSAGPFQLLFVGAVAGLMGMGLSSVDAYTADYTPRRIRARAIGVTNSLFAVAMVPGPIIGGIIFSVSPHALFVSSFAIGMLSLFVGWKLLK